MFCKNCGKQLNDNESFCTNCGTKKESLESNQEPYQASEQPKKDQKQTLGIIAIVLGAVAILFSLFIGLFAAFPFALAGLIVAIIYKGQKSIKIAGIILNVVGLVVISVLFCLMIARIVLNTDEFKDYLNQLENELDYSISENYIAGNYNCTGVDDRTDEYLITLHLNEDNSFLYGPYGKLENNYAKGTYTFVDEEKTNHAGNYKYFMVTFSGSKEDFIVDREENDYGFNSKMEIGVTKESGKKQAIIMFTHNYNMYYCYEE